MKARFVSLQYALCLAVAVFSLHLIILTRSTSSPDGTQRLPISILETKRLLAQSSDVLIVREEVDPHIVLTGTWQLVPDAQSSGGQMAVSTTAGDQVSITFEGDSIVLLRGIGPDGGRADITLDGVHLGSLRFNFFETRSQVHSVYEGLGPGPHVLTLTHVGQTGANPPTRIAIDGFLPASPYEPTTDQVTAIERVNYFREIAGLPSIQGVQSIHLAAQGHAEYVVNNQGSSQLEGLGAHRESPELPGFIGRTSSNRARYFGYTGDVGEDIHYIGDAIGSVDGWMETVYHRNLIMDYAATDAGFGMVNDERGRTDVLNMGARISNQPDGRLLYTYPANGQTQVPRSWNGAEVPDPLPDVDTSVGYPISLYVVPDPFAENLQQTEWHNDSLTYQTRSLDNQETVAPDDGWQLDLAELRDPAGNLVPSYILDRESDPPQFLGSDVVFLIPEQPMEYSTTYTTTVRGADSSGKLFTHTWAFTTIAAAIIQKLDTDIGACEGTIYGATAGPSAVTLHYGLTPEMGNQIEKGSEDSNTNFSFALDNLEINQPYYYQVVSQDQVGQIQETEVLTFTTRPPLLHNVPDEFNSINDALTATRACDTVSVNAGEYHLESTITIPNRVKLNGMGAEQTAIIATEHDSAIQMTDQAAISGFTIIGRSAEFWDAAIWIQDNASPIISNNHIYSASMGIANYCFDPPCTNQPLIHNNLIMDNKERGIADNVGSSQIINNTIISNTIGLQIEGQNSGTSILNNTVVANLEGGIVSDEGDIVHSYNNVWNNGENYRGVIAGLGDISADPKFIDPYNGNFALAGESPNVDAGDPSPSFRDEDGSRNDIGHHGGGLLSSELWVTVTSIPTEPTVGEEMQLQIRVVNPSTQPRQVTIQITIPESVYVIENSVRGSSGNIVVIENTVIVSELTVPANAPAIVEFSNKVALGTDNLENNLIYPIQIDWSGGEISTEFSTQARGRQLFLPLVY